MADGDFSSLEFRGPTNREDVFDVYEAVDERNQIYSCVALCRKDWNDEWAALGGTRWFQKDREQACHEAIELAMAMYIKNSLLRKSERSLEGRENHLFDWQGGKGVIWTPPGAELTPHRLRCHGRLIDWLQGQYIGSGDIGVGGPELRYIAEETPHTIGLGCKRDTGEATAYGIFSGLEQSVREDGFDADPKAPLAGLPVLVIGAGKVGLPLLLLLHRAGAEVYIFDPGVQPDPAAVEDWYQRELGRKAAIGEEHLAALQEVQRAGRIFASEAAALDDPRVRIVSPNGGLAEWLSRPLNGSADTRAEVLAANRAKNGRLRLILGAGNDQVSTTETGKPGRDRTLSTLAEAGIGFVPDTLVSPGGVISVSHERAPEWDADQVNEDAVQVVCRSVEQLYREARRLGGTDAVTMYRAFEKLIAQEWS
jgi:glutamate dehydrogenase/leucine dehydrogenase